MVFDDGLIAMAPVKRRRGAKRRMICCATGLGLVALVLQACAAFPVARLPRVNEIPSQSQVSNKPSVYLAVRFMFDLSKGERPAVEVPGRLPRLRQLTEKVVTEAALFRSYTFESVEAKNMDYVVHIDLTNYGSVGKAIGAGLVAGFTLFIVPVAATDNYALTAKVFDRNGQLLKTYSYDDGITTWIGIWLLPLAGKTPERTAFAVWENMLRTLFRDVLADGLLPYSSLGPRGRMVG